MRSRRNRLAWLEAAVEEAGRIDGEVDVKRLLRAVAHRLYDSAGEQQRRRGARRRGRRDAL